MKMVILNKLINIIVNIYVLNYGHCHRVIALPRTQRKGKFEEKEAMPNMPRFVSPMFIDIFFSYFGGSPDTATK